MNHAKRNRQKQRILRQRNNVNRANRKVRGTIRRANSKVRVIRHGDPTYELYFCKFEGHVPETWAERTDLIILLGPGNRITLTHPDNLPYPTSAARLE